MAQTVQSYLVASESAWYRALGVPKPVLESILAEKHIEALPRKGDRRLRFKMPDVLTIIGECLKRGFEVKMILDAPWLDFRECD